MLTDILTGLAMIIMAIFAGYLARGRVLRKKEKRNVEALNRRLDEVPDESDDPDGNREWLRKRK